MEPGRLRSPPVHSPHDARWRELLLIGEFSQGDTELSASQDADHTSDLRQSNRPSILRDLGSTSKHAHTQDRRAGKTRTSNAAAIHSPSQSSVPMTKSEYANSRGRFLVQELAIFVTHRLFAGCDSNRRVGGGGFVCDPFGIGYVGRVGAVYRGCRCAQPPAIICDPFRDRDCDATSHAFSQPDTSGRDFVVIAPQRETCNHVSRARVPEPHSGRPNVAWGRAQRRPRT